MQVGFRDPVLAERHDLELDPVHADAAVAVLAEDERLAVLEEDGVVVAHVLLGEGLPGAVVEDVAVLQDLDERACPCARPRA